LIFILQIQINEIDGINIIRASPKGLRNLDDGVWRDATRFQEERIFAGKSKGCVGLEIHGGIDDVFAVQEIAR
jgi:hypothetical protein